MTEITDMDDMTDITDIIDINDMAAMANIIYVTKKAHGGLRPSAEAFFGQKKAY